MKRLVNRHYKDVTLIVLVLAAAVAMVAYIFARQYAFQPPSWAPGVHTKYVVDAEFSSANGIVPGQGQPVTIAGVQVGDVGDVHLRDGHAVVQLKIKRKYAPIHRDATVLLRPRTPLKDMSVAVEPGTDASPAVPDGGSLPTGQTQPDVNFDEILANLDVDTRTYLRILLSSAGGALRDPADAPTADGRPSPQAVADLRAALWQFEPLARNARAVTQGLARRRGNLRRVIDRMRLVAGSVGAVDHQLAQLVDASNRTFGALAGRNRELGSALAQLPSTMTETRRALGRTGALAQQLGPAMARLRPTARALAPALRVTRPFVLQTTPILRDQLRPFSRKVTPVVQDLAPAVKGVAAALPSAGRSLTVINRFFDALAYNPAGPEEGYAFWASWLAHIGTSLTNLQDAHGAAVRGLALATCPQLDALHQVELGNPSLNPIIKLLNVADRLKSCPQNGLVPSR